MVYTQMDSEPETSPGPNSGSVAQGLNGGIRVVLRTPLWEFPKNQGPYSRPYKDTHKKDPPICTAT